MKSEEWLKSRKLLLKQVCDQVRQLAGPEDPDVKRYQKRYQSEFLDSWEESKYEDFKGWLKKRRIVFGGDFHAFSQSQRLHLRIFRDLDRPFVLALECIESKMQKVLDQFLKDEIDEATFLQRTRWESRWGFPWENYRPLIVWAKDHDIPVRGLNHFVRNRSLKGLRKRDEHAAKILKKIYKKYPDHLIYVIFGDLHVARKHLPRAFAKQLGFNPRPLILFQNSDQLYFRSQRRIYEGRGEWLKASHDRFCQMSSPPWVKWQSYLMFLEHNFDRNLNDGEEIDLTDQIAGLVRFLGRELRLKIPQNELAVYSLNEASASERWAQGLSRDQKKIAQSLMMQGRSLFLPSVGRIFLSRLSINHSAALAGQYIHRCWNGDRDLAWEMPRDFLALIWTEAVGFYFSKIVNHRRKSESLQALRLRMKALRKGQVGQKALQLAVEEKLREKVYVQTKRKRPLKVSSKNPLVYFEAARLLGEMLGEQIYDSYQSGNVSLSLLQRWLKKKTTAANFETFYFKVIARLENRRSPWIPPKNEAVMTW